MIWKKGEGKIEGYKVELINLHRKIRVFRQLYLNSKKCLGEIRKDIGNSQVHKMKSRIKKERKRRKKRSIV
jgi:hypothetical protein